MWSNDKNFQAKGFLTPPPTRKSKPPLYSPVVMPMSEMKKESSPSNKGDLFHVIHKVPAGDSPYVRAKHVQLIDKDPSKAISLFWAAINSGDRVDSALKDMAVVMKQLNRTDEAIQAIKSFRHLCPHESQESLDNVLIELYKRSGKIEEEIEMLHLKLKHIEEGTTFGRKKTKTARSQGKKIYITIDQERSRILGNLAWAYLQLNDYKAAEELYRKALSLELDLNKQCNLALCLMHMDRIAEAKSMLQAVNDSSKGGQMDVSYAKSFERAIQMLNELELQSVQSPVTQEEKLKEIQISSTSPRNRNSKELDNSVNGGRDKISILGVSRRLADGGAEKTVILNEQNRGTYCQSHFVKKDNFSRYGKGNSEGTLFQPRSPQFFPQTSAVNKGTKGASHENWIGRRFAFANNRKENWAREVEVGSCKKTYASPVYAGGNLKVPLTEPRRHLCLVGIGDRSNGFWGINEHRSSSRRLFFDESMTVEDARALAPQNHIRDWRRSREDLSRPQNHNVDRRGPREELAGAKNEAVIKYFSHLTEDGNQKRFFCEDDVQTKSAVNDVKPRPKLSMESPVAIDRARATETSIGGDWEQTSGLTVSGGEKMTSTDSGLRESITGNLKPTQNISTCETKKSWADMVEEEEQELVRTRADARINEGCYSFQESSFFDSWDSKGFNNENLDSNIIPQTPAKRVDSLSLKLESFDIHNGNSKSRSTISSRDRTARRALCFSQQQTILNFEDNNCVAAADQRESPFGKNITPMRRNRLQVFQNITCTSESP